MKSQTEYKLKSPPEDAISAVKFGPNTNQFLLVSSWDGTVRLYDVTTNNLRHKYTHDAPVLDCCFTERRRLKERYPSLALVHIDREQCSLMLNNYEELLQNRSICEGRCVMGEECPTGICRSRNQNPAAHQSRSRKQRSVRSRSEMTRSPSTTSTASTSKARPRSGPAGLRSLTGAHKIIVVMVLLRRLGQVPV
ncbi:hypothetical protein Zmor_007324 [Zophobas morio]|uniref:Mitotic checkpoint protein BUB3 n=1 Tax=Zophobas morio TaxID=2755281 RepID=A0AA38IZH0_9CUCU|nr:hypothetical protein Zmor_007324 [Zophobas morio]